MNRALERRRLLLATAAVVAVLLAGVIFAAHDAKQRILAALGPRTTVGSITLDYPTVILNDVHVRADPAPGAWPTDREFDAQRVEIDLTATSLWAYRHGEPLALDDVRVADGTLVMRRTPNHLTMLPALRDTQRAEAAALQPSQVPRAGEPATALVIAHMRFDRMGVDFFDETLPDGRRHQLHFEQVQGSVAGLALPRLAQPIALDLQGRLKGVDRDGAVSLKGKLTPAVVDANLALRMTGVDMLALQPYLLKLGERPVRRGTLDLALDAGIVHRAVHAPGQLTMTGLEFAESDGDGTFAGAGHRTVLAALKRDGRIALKFVLDGRTDDPQFKLDERIGLRVAGGLGEALGNGARDVAHGMGDAIRGLFGKGDKPAAPTR